MADFTTASIEATIARRAVVVASTAFFALVAFSACRNSAIGHAAGARHKWSDAIDDLGTLLAALAASAGNQIATRAIPGAEVFAEKRRAGALSRASLIEPTNFAVGCIILAGRCSAVLSMTSRVDALAPAKDRAWSAGRWRTVFGTCVRAALRTPSVAAEEN